MMDFFIKWKQEILLQQVQLHTTIQAVYRSPDMVMGDPGLRKYMQRVNLNYEGEGTTIDANLALRYDYDDQNTPQPDKNSIT